LIWLPDPKELVTYFLGNKTGRNEAPNMIALIDSGKYIGQIVSHVIETPKNTWHGPQTCECDLPVSMPPPDVLVAQLKKFNNPKDAEQAAAPTKEKDDDRR